MCVVLKHHAQYTIKSPSQSKITASVGLRALFYALHYATYYSISRDRNENRNLRHRRGRLSTLFIVCPAGSIHLPAILMHHPDLSAALRPFTHAQAFDWAVSVSSALRNGGEEKDAGDSVRRRQKRFAMRSVFVGSISTSTTSVAKYSRPNSWIAASEFNTASGPGKLGRPKCLATACVTMTELRDIASL